MIYYCLEKSALFEMKNESEQRVFNKMADQVPASCDFSKISEKKIYQEIFSWNIQPEILWKITGPQNLGS